MAIKMISISLPVSDFTHSNGKLDWLGQKPIWAEVPVEDSGPPEYRKENVPAE